MKKMPILIMLTFVVIAFFLNILGLMQLIPPIITLPLLFISIFIIIYYVNNRKRFRGF